MIVITGANGQLARALRRLCLERDIAHTALARDALDITDGKAVASTLAGLGEIGCIINCAAYTQVDLAESHPQEAYAVNALAPWNLARTGIPVIHVSTDYVFDGTTDAPYETDAPARPVSVYGLSKRAGETALLEGGFEGLIVRTAWAYSADPEAKNFLNTMKRLFASRPEVCVVNDQKGAPTLADDLANILLSLYEKGLHRRPMEVVHATNAGEATWFEFAREIARLTKASAHVRPIATEQYPTPAHRPTYSVLSLRKLRSWGICPRDWKAALADALRSSGCSDYSDCEAQCK